MIKLKKYLSRFVKCEDGAEIIEVAIVIALIAVLAVAIGSLIVAVKGKVEEAQSMVTGIEIPTELQGGAGGP